MQSDSCWQERVPEPAGLGPETPQPLGGGTPGRPEWTARGSAVGRRHAWEA